MTSPNIPYTKPYACAGPHGVVDLGDWWEATTGNPVPLGAILVRRDIDDAPAHAIDAAIRRSLHSAGTHEAAISITCALARFEWTTR